MSNNYNNKPIFRDLSKGITVVSEETVDLCLSRIGIVEKFECKIIRGGWQVNIIGNEGIIECYGFSWGYGGTGPHGLHRSLVKTNFHDKMNIDEEALLNIVRTLPQDKDIIFDFKKRKVEVLENV